MSDATGGNPTMPLIRRCYKLAAAPHNHT
eukprot:SAG31_NODE_31282_length_370_cov_0.571956_1_plen_28_part_10